MADEKTQQSVGVVSDLNNELAQTLIIPSLNPELEWILGRPCFAVANMAWRLGELGLYDVKRKAESEQAAAIHFMLTMYAKHGDGWREKAEVVLKG